MARFGVQWGVKVWCDVLWDAVVVRYLPHLPNAQERNQSGLKFKAATVSNLTFFSQIRLVRSAR